MQKSLDVGHDISDNWAIVFSDLEAAFNLLKGIENGHIQSVRPMALLENCL